MRTRRTTPTLEPTLAKDGMGAQGAQGRQGAQGERGPTGAGDPGPKGDQGAPGERGYQGAVGAQGGEGAPGAQGAQGSAGPTGLDGVQGDVGSPGGAGPKGDRGEVGFQGVQGSQGDAGPQGDIGPMGAFKKWSLWMWSCVGVDGTKDEKFLHAAGGGAPSKNERVSFWGPTIAPGVVTDVAVFLSVAMTRDDVALALRINNHDKIVVSVPAGSTQAVVTRDLAYDAGEVFSVSIRAGDEVNIDAGIRVVVYGHP